MRDMRASRRLLFFVWAVAVRFEFLLCFEFLHEGMASFLLYVLASVFRSHNDSSFLLPSLFHLLIPRCLLGHRLFVSFGFFGRFVTKVISRFSPFCHIRVIAGYVLPLCLTLERSSGMTFSSSPSRFLTLFCFPHLHWLFKKHPFLQIFRKRTDIWHGLSPLH